MSTDLIPARAEIQGLLCEYTTLSGAINETKKRQSLLRDQIKQFMELEREDELTDGEHGITVRLQRRRGSPSYDVRSMPDSLVLAMRGLAALNVDTKVISAIENKVIEGVDIRSYELPGLETTALVIADDRGGVVAASPRLGDHHVAEVTPP